MTMAPTGGDGGKLPVEIIERVLSFLPAPALCRMRSVCKAWNELIARPSFHDLCDQNRSRNVYLFMCGKNGRQAVGSIFWSTSTDTYSFLDMDAMRWYSIQAPKFPRIRVSETRVMAMDDGLVCELVSVQGGLTKYSLTLCDPVAQMRKVLPALPEFAYPNHHSVTRLIDTVVDDASRSYKVFLFSNRYSFEPRAYVYESFTYKWRGFGNVMPNEVNESAVHLHQSLFVLNRADLESEDDQLSLQCHNIQIAEKSRKLVVQLTHAQLRHIFGIYDSESKLKVKYGYPCFDSNGKCNSVVLLATKTGELRRHYLATGSVEVLPSHPSMQSAENPAPALCDDGGKRYYAKTTKLSLRNLLAERPNSWTG